MNAFRQKQDGLQMPYGKRPGEVCVLTRQALYSVYFLRTGRWQIMKVL